MQPKRLMYGLARVRIAGTDLIGDEILAVPPYYERHIFVKEYSQQAYLRWYTFRPILGRGKVFPTPEDIPVRYKMLAHAVDPQTGQKTTQVVEPAFGFPQSTGIFVGDPINAYVPLPLITYTASPFDQYPVSKFGFYPNVYPYAIPTYVFDTQSRPGFFEIKTEPLPVAVNFPFSFSFEELGLVFRGSSGIVYPVTNMHIPKRLVITTTGGVETVEFPQDMVSWREVSLWGESALDKVRRTIYTKSLLDQQVVSVKPTEIIDRSEGSEVNLIEGKLVGVYIDWVSGGDGYLTSDFKDFTFGFYVAPMAPIFPETAGLTKASMIRVFWGGYYMLEILPQRTNFYFFKDGYSVPADPTIPTEVVIPSLNPIYKYARQYGGVYTYLFSLKYLRPIVNGDPFPPNVFLQPLTNMSFSWGSKGIQAAGTYDFYIIMHIRNHVCIFSYNSIMRGVMTGAKVEPLFAFNPLEYIYRHFGAAEARRWWAQNNYAIARADCPPKMWLFNVSSYVMIPYMEYTETAIATKPSFIVPNNPQILVDPSIFHLTKVAPSGIFVKGTVGATGLNVPEIPIVLSFSEPLPPELSTPAAMIYGDEVSPNYLQIPEITLTRGHHRAFALMSPHPDFVGMRIYAIPSPSSYYPFIVEHVAVDNPVKRYLIGEIGGKTPQGVLRMDDILMTSVVFRTPIVDAQSGQTFWGEISGFYPTTQERSFGAQPTPTFDGEAGPFIDYLDTSRGRVITITSSPLLPRPPIFIGADIFRLPITAASRVAPPPIRFIAPAPRHSPLDTGVESISVTLSDSLGGSSATVKVVVDESLFGQWAGIQPIETVATGLTIDLPPSSIYPEIPYPSKLLYRRMIIECGYIMETPTGGIEGVLYPVFDGIITGLTISGSRETATGRQIELTIKGADIFTRLRWVPATGKDPILDNWTPAAFAFWALAACGLSPLRVKGITGLPLGAPLTWWLGNERIIGDFLLGGYGFPLQNLPETPRTEIGAGSSLGDALERYAGVSGCEVISTPSPSVIFPLIQYRNNLNMIWRDYLLPHEFNQFLTLSQEYISPTVLSEIGGIGNYWWSLPWRSTLAIVPAGYYSPIPSWTLVIGPEDYTMAIVPASMEEVLYQVTVPEAPFTRGLIDLQVEEGIWNLPTHVTVEGLSIYGVPFYYIWADINREVNPFAWYYGGFRIPRYILSTDIISIQQAKLAALRSYFAGRLFPPKTMKVALSVGLPFLYPRQTVRLVTSSFLYNLPPVGRSIWVIRAVTHTWEAGDTPKTVLDLCVPHWFPIGIPTQ